MIALSGSGPLVDALLTALERRGLDCRVIGDDAALGDDCCGLVRIAARDHDDNRAAFLQLRAAAATIQARLAAGRPFLLAGILALDGGLGFAGGPLHNPASAGLAGLVKTAAREWPGLLARVIDPGEADAEAIAEALLAAGPVEWALGGCQMRQVALVPEATATEAWPTLDANDGLVISGGGRGVTAEVAVALAARFGCRCLLLGRSPLSDLPAWVPESITETDLRPLVMAQEGIRAPRELRARCRDLLAASAIAATCARIAEAGGRAVYASADGRDPEAVAAAVASFRTAGPVRGIVHGAGVLADRHIIDQTPEQWDQVYGTKVAGLDALLAACVDDDLRLLLGFSSSTARFGRSGQVAYAMGNEVLAKRLRREAARRPTCRCLAADWGPWDGGMVGPELKALFASEGIAVIPTDAGAAWAAEACARPPGSPVEVVILGHGSRLDDAERGETLLISPQSLPLLDDHVIDGRRVLPAAWACEMLVRGAGETPGPGLVIEDFAVLSGLTFEHEDTRQLRLHRDGRSCLLLEGDRPRYRARIIRQTETDELPVCDPGSVTLADPGWYADGRLFHGPRLHLLDTVELGETGLTATADIGQLGLPAALDACFQACILWSWRQHQAPCLPLACRRIALYTDTWPRRIILTGCLRSQADTCDADFRITDPDGHLIVAITAAQATISAGLIDAFHTRRDR